VEFIITGENSGLNKNEKVDGLNNKKRDMVKSGKKPEFYKQENISLC